MLELAPIREDFSDEQGNITRGWASWFQRVKLYAGSVSESGTTANRPTSKLFIGRRFFDTTLGKPIYVKSLSPTVWVDGVGTTS